MKRFYISNSLVKKLLVLTIFSIVMLTITCVMLEKETGVKEDNHSEISAIQLSLKDIDKKLETQNNCAVYMSNSFATIVNYVKGIAEMTPTIQVGIKKTQKGKYLKRNETKKTRNLQNDSLVEETSKSRDGVDTTGGVHHHKCCICCCNKIEVE